MSTTRGSSVGLYIKPSPAYAVRRYGHDGWAVVGPRGLRVGAIVADHAAAEARRAALQAEADAKAKRGTRACLCCGASFVSQGIHNRLCTPCRGRDAGDEAQRPYIERRAG